MEMKIKNAQITCPQCNEVMAMIGKSILPSDTECYIAECNNKKCIMIVRFKLLQISILQSSHRSTA